MSKIANIVNDVIAQGASARAKAAKPAKITGTKTVAEMQADLKKRASQPHGGKAGQARANQSAKYSAPAMPAKGKAAAKPATPTPKANPDKVVSVKATASGADAIVVKAGDQTISIPRSRFTGELTKLAVVGASLKAVQAYIAQHKPEAKLAAGVTGRDAPHASKAVGDAAAAKRGPATATKATPVKASPTTAKPRTVTAKGDRAYTVVNRDHGARAGSKRALQLEIVFKHNTTSAAKAAGAEGVDIAFAASKGFIKLA